MKLYRYLFFCSIFFTSFLKAQTPIVDCYRLETLDKKISFEAILQSDKFEKINDLTLLNFGLSTRDNWLKINLQNLKPFQIYKLYIESIVADSIEIYQIQDKVVKKSFVGEAFWSGENFPVHYFKSKNTSTLLYLKVIGNGQPIALPLKITELENSNNGILKSLISGIIIGIIILLFFINLIFYFEIKEKLYLYFAFLNFNSAGFIAYFDGYIKLLFFENSLYWNNQIIAIFMGFSFLSTNAYFISFTEIKKHKPQLIRYFRFVNISLLGFVFLSFWHPTGFNWYIKYNLLITSFEAVLLIISLFFLKQNIKEYFVLQSISIGLLITFGVITQLYFYGILPISILTKYSVHGMVFPQLIFQTFALYKRQKVIATENALLQTKLLNASEHYSQSLIITLENERKRLSREFHDSIGQNLLVIRNRILLMIKKENEISNLQKLEGLASITSETLDEIRYISQNLRPTTLDTLGLTITIRNMIDRMQKATNIKIKYSCKNTIDNLIDKDLEINIYRIMQELMSNCIKHSKAKNADLNIFYDKEFLKIGFIDDGIGFELEKATFGNGLSGIQERLNILKGKMKIQSKKGCEIEIIIPLK